MSQRECAGFNWPECSVSVPEPICISPEAVNRADVARAARSICAHPVLAPRAFFCSAVSGEPRVASVAVGRAHPASRAAEHKSFPPMRFGPVCGPFTSFTSGLGQPRKVESFTLNGRAEARSSGSDRPAGVAIRFHVSANKVEPSSAVFRCNLLSKNDRKAALSDEVVGRRPKVPLVSKSASWACRAERLTGAGEGGDGAIIGPSGEAERIAPAAEPGEEVVLSEAS